MGREIGVRSCAWSADIRAREGAGGGSGAKLERAVPGGGRLFWLVGQFPVRALMQDLRDYLPLALKLTAAVTS